MSYHLTGSTACIGGFFMLSTDLFYASIGGFLTFHTAFNENLLQRVLPYFVQVLTWIAYLTAEAPRPASCILSKES